MDDLVTISQAARILGCDGALIYYRIEKGIFPEPVMVAGKMHFSRQAVEKHKEEHPLKRGRGTNGT